MKTSILAYLEETARRVPEKTAFYDDRESLSFAALLEQAQRIGSYLAQRVAPRQPVALLLDARSIRNLPALFGILYAGCAYAPLDIAMPPERLRLLLTLLSPAAALVDERGEKAIRACEMADIPVCREQDAAAAPADQALLDAVRAQSSVFDPLSILYTSGSTGIPKGSVQTHFSYLHWTEATIAMYGLTEETVLANQSPFFYANSILEIFPPVALGASVYMLPAGALTFPARLIDSLNAHCVTELCMTPSSFISIVHAGALRPGCLPHLKWGIMSGESMPWGPLERWMDAAPNAGWWHFYGSTEMFSVAVGKVARTHQLGDRLPVGWPFPLVHICFVDENGDALPPGEPGEMLVSSPWIASGYYRDPERTASSWVIDPLGQGWQERFFRGGDIGYIRPDGQLMVLGRRDTQIKHLGYRMEIGEVEAALQHAPGWQEGCVLFDGERLWCFYTGDIDEKTLKNSLRERLARYMLPDVFVRLDELPRTATMKLDRNALKQRMK